MEKHNRRATLIQERMHAQKQAAQNLRDGDLEAAVRCQRVALELETQVQQLTLEIFLENTGSKPDRNGHIAAIAIRAS